MRSPDVRAFTLIEILVSILVVGLLIGLTIPAVQSARESARRMECSNRLRQIGLALTAHHDAHGRYPAGVRADGLNEEGVERATHPFSPHAALLPFLDQTVLYHSLNIPLFPTRGVHHPTALTPDNATVASMRLAVFLCPSDAPPSDRTPGNNFYACTGSIPIYTDFWSDHGGGVFSGFKERSAADIMDGLSQTAGYSERIFGSWTNDRFDRRRDVWYIGPFGDPDSNTMLKLCGSLRSTPPDGYLYGGETWILSDLEITLYNHVAPPNWRGTDCISNNPGPPDHRPVGSVAATARSFHPGGVNVLFMDGSVRFESNGIDLGIWRAIATRADGDAAP